MNRFLIVINSVLVLISCQNGNYQHDKKVFSYNSPTGITSLDPAYARTPENIRAVNQLFNGLVELDQNLNIIPAVAKSWEIDSSSTVYTFHLRNNVFFHKHKSFGSGLTRKVVASDFKYSLERIINPVTASDGSWIFNGLVTLDSSFLAVNDSTFQIKLTKPYTSFLSILTMAYCYVVPEEVVVDLKKDFGKSPIGTGPFQFANWEEGIKLNLIKNQNYYESSQGNEIPKIDAVSIGFIQNKQTELLALIQGKITAFNGIESDFKDEILQAEGSLSPKYSSNFNLIKSPFLNTEYLAFQLADNSVLSKDIWLRKAMDHAIDRQAMITYLRNSVGKPADAGFIPKGLEGHVSFDSSIYNLERAKWCFQKSSYANKVYPITLTTTKEYLDFCVLVQKDFSSVGIKIDIDVVPSSLLKQQKSTGEVSFFRGSWIADYPDGENYMSCFYSGNKAPQGPNYSRFENAEFDSLYLVLLSSVNPKRKKNIFMRMEKIIDNNKPLIVLFYDESIWIHQKNLTGLRINALNYFDLRKADFAVN